MKWQRAEVDSWLLKPGWGWHLLKAIIFDARARASFQTQSCHGRHDEAVHVWASVSVTHDGSIPKTHTRYFTTHA